MVKILFRHPMQIVIQDKPGELKSQALKDYIESIGAEDYFSVAYEQWQIVLAESSIGSLMLLTRSQMAESGMGGRFWFRAMVSGKDARNEYHERIGTTRHHFVLENPKNVFMFRAFGPPSFGCRMLKFLNDI